MADFEEVMQDAGKDIKSFFKKNPFILLCVGVGLVALFLWWVRQRNATSSDDSYYSGEVAVGYGGYGYPSVGGSDYYDSANSEYWETVLDNWEDKFTALSDKHTEDLDLLREKHDTDIETLNDTWQERYDSLLDKIGESDDGYWNGSYTPSAPTVSNRDKVNEQSVIDQMKANSNYWHFASDSEKEGLHDMNVELGDSIGAEYDSKTGTWWKNGELLYTVDVNSETPTTSLGRKSVPNSSVTYDDNTDYQAKINAAILAGEGAAVINSLNVQRNAKIVGKGTVYEKPGFKPPVTYDKNTDYQDLINKAKAQGADQSVINNLTEMRNAKIKGENIKVN